MKSLPQAREKHSPHLHDATVPDRRALTAAKEHAAATATATNNFSATVLGFSLSPGERASVDLTFPSLLKPAALLTFALLFLLTPRAHSAEPWETALSRMPLPTNVRELNGTNFGPALLQAFQSNSVAKALILMPGAIDEFYFFRRARAQLPPAATLLNALRALENQTRIRATFRAPCLLLHAPPDPVTPAVRILDQPTFDRLCARRFPATLDYFDRDWPALRPLLVRAFTSIWSGYPEVLPAGGSSDSWHFYRASIRAWNLDAREGLEALTLATRTAVTIDQRRLLFECDPRASAPVGR